MSKSLLYFKHIIIDYVQDNNNPFFPYFSAVFEAGQKCTLLDMEKSRSINFRFAFLLSKLYCFLLDEYLLLKSKRIAETTKTIIPNNAFPDILRMNIPKTIEKIKLAISEFIKRSPST